MRSNNPSPSLTIYVPGLLTAPTISTLLKENLLITNLSLSTGAKDFSSSIFGIFIPSTFPSMSLYRFISLISASALSPFAKDMASSRESESLSSYTKGLLTPPIIETRFWTGFTKTISPDLSR